VDRPLLVAALAYGAATVLGARVAVREDVPGEPLGVRVGGRVATQLAVGWGAGVSAPWPMAVAALGTALRAGRGPGTAAIALGAATVAGQLVEPVAWGRRPSSPAVTRSLALNLVTSAGLVLAGRRRVLAADLPR
jgi:hypothetical protein